MICMLERKLFFITKRESKTKKYWEKALENTLTNKKRKDDREDQSLQLW